MRRTRYVVLPVRSWQYCGLLVVSLACLTLGLVSRDREGRQGSLVGPDLMHTAPHDVDACPNSLAQCSSSDVPSSLVEPASSSTLTRSSLLNGESRVSSRSRTSPVRERHWEPPKARAGSTERRSIENFEQQRARSSERRNSLTRSRNLFEPRIGMDRRNRHVDSRVRGQMGLNFEDRRVGVNSVERRGSRDVRSDAVLRQRPAQESRIPMDARNERSVRMIRDQSRSSEPRVDSLRAARGVREKRFARENAFRSTTESSGTRDRYRKETNRFVADRRRESASVERRVRDIDSRRGQRESMDARQRTRSVGDQLAHRQQRLLTRTERRSISAEPYRDSRRESRSVDDSRRSRVDENRVDSRVEHLARSADRILKSAENRRDARTRHPTIDARTRIYSRTGREFRGNRERRARSAGTRFGPRVERASVDTERSMGSREPSLRSERSSSRASSFENRFDSRTRLGSRVERRVSESNFRNDFRQERSGRVAERRARSAEGRFSSLTDDRMERRLTSNAQRTGANERRFDSRADRERESEGLRRHRSVESRLDSRRERRSVDFERRIRAIGERVDSRTESRRMTLERRVRDGRDDSHRARLSTKSDRRVDYPHKQLESTSRRESPVSRRRNDLSTERRRTSSTGFRIERSIKSESEQRNVDRLGGRSDRLVKSEARNAERRTGFAEYRKSRFGRELADLESRRVHNLQIDSRVRDSAERKATVVKRQARMMENRRVHDSRMSRDEIVQHGSSDRFADTKRGLRLDSRDGIRRNRDARPIRARESRNRSTESSLQRVRRAADDVYQQGQRVREARKLLEVSRREINLKQGVRQFEATRLLNRREKKLPSTRVSEEFRGLQDVRVHEPQYFLATLRKHDEYSRSHLNEEAPNNHARKDYHKEITDRKVPTNDPWKQLHMEISTDSQYQKRATLPASQTLENVRHSIILLLCAVYGMTIFKSKSGFFR